MALSQHISRQRRRGGKWAEVEQYLSVDVRYFALMLLLKSHLGVEVVSHESVHAAWRWRERMGGWPELPIDSLEEESICYPTGRICRLIYQQLRSRRII